MIVYSTKLPVSSLLTADVFESLALQWRKQVRFDAFTDAVKVLDGYVNGRRHPNGRTYKENGMSLEVFRLPENNIIGGRFQKVDASGQWITEMILNTSTHCIVIRQHLNATESTTDFSRFFYPPHFVRLLICGGYIESAKGLAITSEVVPYTDEVHQLITNDDFDMVDNVLITGSPESLDHIDLQKLAGELQGVARVIVRKEEGLPRHVEIFHKNPNYEPTSLNWPFYQQDWETADEVAEMMQSILDEVHDGGIIDHREPLETWSGIITQSLRYEQTRHRTEAERSTWTQAEVDSYLDEISKECTRLQERNQELLETQDELNAEINRLQAEVSKYESANRTCQQQLRKGGFLSRGKEADLFPDEVRSLIIDILEDRLQTSYPESREYDVLTDILSHNDPSNKVMWSLANELPRLLDNYRKMTGDIENTFSRHYITIEHGTHYKCKLGNDERYIFNIACTPGDRNSGKAAKRDAFNKLFGGNPHSK